MESRAEAFSERASVPLPLPLRPGAHQGKPRLLGEGGQLVSASAQILMVLIHLQKNSHAARRTWS